MTRTQWEVTSFSLRTGAPDSTTDIIYANGRMQVQVNVLIKAIVKGQTKRYLLTQSELASIELVDYDNPNHVLSDE